MTENTWKILKLDWKTPGFFFFLIIVLCMCRFEHLFNFENNCKCRRLVSEWCRARMITRCSCGLRRRAASLWCGWLVTCSRLTRLCSHLTDVSSRARRLTNLSNCGTATLASELSNDYNQTFVLTVMQPRMGSVRLMCCVWLPHLVPFFLLIYFLS